MLAAQPLFPLYPVQRSPEARFERFGQNDSQLFGKPLLQLASKERARTQALTSTAAEPPKALGARVQRPIVAEAAPTYGGPFGFRKPASTPRLGSQLDLQG